VPSVDLAVITALRDGLHFEKRRTDLGCFGGRKPYSTLLTIGRLAVAGFPTSYCAQVAEVSHTAATRFLRVAGIPAIDGRRLPTFKYGQIRELCLAGYSNNQIELAVGCSARTVTRHAVPGICGCGQDRQHAGARTPQCTVHL